MEVFDMVSLVVGRTIVGLWVLAILIAVPAWLMALAFKKVKQ